MTPGRSRVEGLTPVDRRAVLAAACLLPFAPLPSRAAVERRFWVNVNFQGLDGGSTLPGREGTDYFAATPADLADVATRTTGPSRLPFRWERLQPVPGGPLDPTYLGHIAGVADAAAGVKRAVILDCHNYMRRSVDGKDRTLGAKDGVLTSAHLADLWYRLASALASHPGVAGWDIMNEPHDLGDGQDLAAIMQGSVDAIDAVESRKAIFVEGDRWSSAAHWVEANPGYPLRDTHDRITYSAHCYADPDASGTHFDYAALVKAGIPDTVLVDRTRGFAAWCADRKLRGHIGETNVGTDDPRWLTVLDKGLTFWESAGLPVNLWLYGSRFGASPFNLCPVDGVEAPQWRVIAPHVHSGGTGQ